ncbi:MAG: SPOR domain-containing protein [Oceanidesulfovibrio sp.]
MRFELGKKQQKAEGSAKRYKLELSMIGWVATITVLLIGVTWVFIFGVLVGRGYRPEQTVPELARIMPSDNRTNATAGAENEVLKAEELQFYDLLKEDAPAAVKDDPEALASRAPVKTPEKKAAQQQQAPQQQSAEAKKAEAKTVAPEPQPKKKAAASPEKSADLLVPPEPAPTEEPATRPKTQQAAAPQKSEAADESDAQQVYDYVYQAAAFADPKSAETFRGQVSGLGFESHVEKSQGEGKTWHRVMVHFQGRPEDTRQLKARLAEIGVERIILRQKQPQ